MLQVIAGAIFIGCFVAALIFAAIESVRRNKSGPRGFEVKQQDTGPTPVLKQKDHGHG